MTVLALFSLAALSGCGSERPSPSAGDDPSVQPSTQPSSQPTIDAEVVDPSGLLVASGLLMQRTANGPVELCMGAVAESYPPQCGGPTLVGEIDWDTLKPERASGVTWTSGSVWAVGRFNPKAGKSGTFTLDRPVSLTPPAEVEIMATDAPLTFPQLCDDPYAGGGRRGAGSSAEQTSLGELLPTLDGYVGSWVSDGSSMFNVVVTGDPKAAHAKLRKVWPGGLCVEQRDVATEKDVQAAQDALAQRFKGLLSTGGDTMNGRLDVQVTLLDQATLDGILETVKPWLEPKDLRVTSAFQPLTR